VGKIEAGEFWLSPSSSGQNEDQDSDNNNDYKYFTLTKKYTQHSDSYVLFAKG
jgi:hypothetical protein